MAEIPEKEESIIRVSGQGWFGVSQDGQHVYLSGHSSFLWLNPFSKRAHLLPDQASIDAVRKAHVFHNYYLLGVLILISFLTCAAYMEWFEHSMSSGINALVCGATVGVPFFITNVLMKRALAPFDIVEIELAPAETDDSD